MERYEQAAKLLSEGLDSARRSQPEGHPSIRTFSFVLSMAYSGQGRYVEAERFFHDTLELFRRELGDSHGDTLAHMGNMAVYLYLPLGRYSEAEALLTEMLGVYRRTLPERHAWIPGTMKDLAEVYSLQGRQDEAERLGVEALGRLRDTLGNDHSVSIQAMITLAAIYTSQGRYPEGERLAMEAVEASREQKREEETLASMYVLARIYAARNERTRALEHLRQVVDGGWAQARLFHHREFANLRGDPAFEAMVAEVKKRIEKV
jgi:tetratricopeptide (TPR) repeat protein